jgi:NADH-quinone oxidoreductase subunit N
MRDMFSGEFFSLVLFATLGMMVMISANHFLTLYLGLELLSLSLYAMVALRRDSVVATEAAMKFFILGALASGFLLYGMSLVYGATGGALDITRVAEVIQGGVDNPKVLVVGLVFIIAGISFKLSVAPFHMWVPDVYHGAPTAVVLFIGSAPKIAAFGFIMRLLVEGMGGMAADWQEMLIIIAVLSMLVGNFAAIAQTNIKRMLAYSTISHMGFMLLGIISADNNGYSSAMFYMIVYVVITLGTFGMIMLLSRKEYEVEKIDDFKGLNKRSPWYAFITLLFMLSLAGIPPTVGFYAKLSVLQAVMGVGYIWLAVMAVLFSLVGAFYYLRIIKLMYFDEPESNAAIAPAGDVGLLISTNGMAVLILGIFPQTLMTLCFYALH